MSQSQQTPLPDDSLPVNLSPAVNSLKMDLSGSDLNSSLASVSLASTGLSEQIDSMNSSGDTSPFKGVQEEISAVCQTNIADADSIEFSAADPGVNFPTSSVFGDSFGGVNCASQTPKVEVPAPVPSHYQKILELEAQVQSLSEAEVALRLLLKEANDEIERLKMAGDDHHDLFLCEREKHCAKLLSDEIEGKTLVHLLKVVGWIDYPGTGVKEEQSAASKLLKLVLLGMIDLVFRLHRKGLSLNGDFSLKDFYWINHKIKLSETVKSKICGRSVAKIRIDFASLCKTIRTELLAELKVRIPVDIEYLLQLMTHGDAFRDQALIRYNCSLMDNLSKRGHFFTLWDRFLQVEMQDKKLHGEDRSLYRSEKVLEYIAAGKNDWKFVIAANEYLKKISDFHFRKSDPSKYMQLGPRRLLEYVRHSLHHFVDYAVDANGIIVLHDKDMYPIIEACYSGLLSQFQTGMHLIGELEIPHLDNTMKV